MNPKEQLEEWLASNPESVDYAPLIAQEVLENRKSLMPKY